MPLGMRQAFPKIPGGFQAGNVKAFSTISLIDFHVDIQPSRIFDLWECLHKGLMHVSLFLETETHC
jgi:hypothetical protein